MELTFLIIEFVTGFIFGALFTYFFVKGQPDRINREVLIQLDNQESLHKQTKQLLDDTTNKLNNATKELEEEQRQRVRFETQAHEAIMQLKSLQQDYEKYQNDLMTKNHEQEIINAQKEKAKIETELRDAINTISQLDADIKSYRTELSVLQNEIENLKATNAEFTEKYKESLKEIENQEKSINNVNTILKDAFNSLSTQATKLKEIIRE